MIIFKNDGDATPSCGSYTISDEVTYDKHAFSTYTKKGYLGWRFCRQDNGDGNNPGMSFDPYSSDTVGSNEGWFKELGFMIEVRASGFQNCKIEILSDARTQQEKDVVEQNFTDPGNNNEPINMSGSAPMLYKHLQQKTHLQIVIWVLVFMVQHPS